MSADGTMLEIFASPAGSFTVLKTAPSLVTCLVDAGDNWLGVASGSFSGRLDSRGIVPGQ